MAHWKHWHLSSNYFNVFSYNLPFCQADVSLTNPSLVQLL